MLTHTKLSPARTRRRSSITWSTSSPPRRAASIPKCRRCSTSWSSARSRRIPRCAIRTHSSSPPTCTRPRRARQSRGRCDGKARPGTTKTIKLDADTLKTASPFGGGRDRIRYAASRIAQVRLRRCDRPVDGTDPAGPRAAHPGTPPGRFLSRIRRDPGRRRLFIAVAVAALVGGAIAFV